jgi:ABC-2 type transport system permease protein
MIVADASRPRLIDGPQLRALLRCYWRLSTRGKLAGSMRRRQSGKPRGLLFIAAMYMLVGLTTSFSVFAHMNVFTYAMILHSMTFLVVGMAITSESGDILFSANESDVLLHRPIHSRTLLLAKGLNLIGLALFLAGSLNFFPTFFGLAAPGAQWWFPLTHIASITLLSIFCCSAVVCTYGLIVRFLDREKFDNFAAWTQVAMSFLFVGGYQLVPRLMQHFGGLNLENSPFLLPLPPAWFAAVDAVGNVQPAQHFIWWLVVIGFAATGALTYSAIGKLAPSYGEALARLGEARQRTAKSKPATQRTNQSRHSFFRWWMPDPIERASFHLAAAYMRRDREIKLRLYPSLGSFLVFPLMGLLDRRTGASPFIPLLTVWMLGQLPIIAMETLRTSSQAAAADIFATAPLESGAPVFLGVRKATIFYLMVPALCIATGLLGLVNHSRSALFLALPGLVAIPIVSLLPACVDTYLPLSRSPQVGTQSAKNTTLMFGTMLTMGILAGISYVASEENFLPILLLVETAIVVTLYWILKRHIQSRPLRWD